MSPHRPMLGAVLLVLAMACFAISDVLAKQLAAMWPSIAIAWFRYVLLLATVLPFALARPQTWRSARPSLQMGRALGLAGSAVLFLYGLKMLPVAEATAMVFASPLFVTLLAMSLLRERIEARRWLPVLLGFGGVLVVVRPGGVGFSGAEIFPLLSSIAWATAVIFTRKLSASDSAATTMLYSALLGTVGLGAWLPSLDTALLWQTAPRLFLMSAAWCGAQWLTIAAYRRATPSTIAPFAYSQLVWAGLLGWAVFHHVPDPLSLLGIAIILLSGLLAAWQAAAAAKRKN